MAAPNARSTGIQGFVQVNRASTTALVRSLYQLVGRRRNGRNVGRNRRLALAVRRFSLGDLTVSTPARNASDPAGIDVNRSSRRALRDAAARGNTNTVTALIEAGFDANGSPYRGAQPHGAARFGRHELIGPLIRAGSDPNARLFVTSHNDAPTPLPLVVQGNHPAVVSALLDTPGIQVDVGDRFHRTPIGFAALEARWSMVRQLIDAGADINQSIRQHVNRSLLQIAAETGDQTLVQWRLDIGGNRMRTMLMRYDRSSLPTKPKSMRCYATRIELGQR
ncbi:MAG: ankyrin repeat domain-containing protein [Pseudomonadota bacterium]